MQSRRSVVSVSRRGWKILGIRIIEWGPRAILSYYIIIDQCVMNKEVAIAAIEILIFLLNGKYFFVERRTSRCIEQDCDVTLRQRLKSGLTIFQVLLINWNSESRIDGRHRAIRIESARLGGSISDQTVTLGQFEVDKNRANYIFLFKFIYFLFFVYKKLISIERNMFERIQNDGLCWGFRDDDFSYCQ